jgi:hypothetical protein
MHHAPEGAFSILRAFDRNGPNLASTHLIA